MSAFELLQHSPHPGCVITSAFRSTLDSAQVATVIVDAGGYFIYGNASALGMLGYRLSELTTQHVFDVVQADQPWVASEFQHLVDHQHWGGRVLLRRKPGDVVRVAVNAYGSGMPGGDAEYVGLMHHTQEEGPAIDRLPDAAQPRSLTARDVSLLQLIAEGFADKELAGILGLSVWTVNKDVGSVMRKLNAASRTAACLTAVRARIIV